MPANREADQQLELLTETHRNWCNYCKGSPEICASCPSGGCSLRDYLNALSAPAARQPEPMPKACLAVPGSREGQSWWCPECGPVRDGTECRAQPSALTPITQNAAQVWREITAPLPFARIKNQAAAGAAKYLSAHDWMEIASAYQECLPPNERMDDAVPAAVDEPLTNEHDQGGAVNFNYDIVKLLRGCVSPSLNSARQIMLKAAEEIERLRAPAAVELERAALVCDANAIKALRADALQAAVAHDEDADAIRALAPVLDQVAVPKEIDRSKHQHALEIWNACMGQCETLESTWPKLVRALAIRASVPGEQK